MASAVDSGRISRIVERGIDGQRGWLDPLGERLQLLLNAIWEDGPPWARRMKDLLNGTWLGHPVHPALSDVPVGAWVTGAVLDLAGSRHGADTAIGLGVAAALPTAAAGWADWHYQTDAPRRVGLVHALLNITALVLFVGSLVARRSGHRALGVGLSTTGLTLATGGAYLGGELSFAKGVSVDRNAWQPAAEGWQIAARAADLAEGQLSPGEIDVDGEKLPLVLLKQGGRILALGGICSHKGGPLAEGKLIGDGCVECPWHYSRFDLRDGRTVQGPAAYPQPVYEARERSGQVEVRRA